MPGLNDRQDPNDLVSYSILDTGEYTDAGQHTKIWSNDTGKKLQIVGIQLGTWCQYGLVADTFVGCWRVADNTLLMQLGWDHYADPNLPLQALTHWLPPPYAFYLYPGDTLKLMWWFVAAKGTPGVAHNCTIWCPAGS